MAKHIPRTLLAHHVYIGPSPRYPEPRCEYCGLQFSSSLHDSIPFPSDQGEREMTEAEYDGYSPESESCK